MKRILIVDDEPSLIKGLRFNLEQQDGYTVDEALDGEQALEKFSPDRYDLVLLDLMLPKLDGMEVCQRIRSISNVPIIMLTAKDDDMDKIMGLEYGADDYLTKPFNMLELKARIKTIFRRVENTEKNREAQVLRAKNMVVNLENRSVEVAGQEISLTAKEFDLLQLFITNKGKVYDREKLLELIWKYEYLGDLRTVDVHIRRLREKIESNPAKPEYILTKWEWGIISRTSSILYSIRWRFVLIYLFVAAAAFAAVTVVVSYLAEDYLVRIRVQDQMGSTNSVAVSLAPYLQSGNSRKMYEIAEESSKEYGGRFLVLNRSGIVQVDSFSILNGQKLEHKEISDVLLGPKDASYGFHKMADASGNEFYAVYYTAAIVYDSQTIGAVLYADDIQDVVDITRDFIDAFIVVSVFACFILLLVSLIFSGYITRPINELKKGALSMARGNLHQRVEVPGRSEIAQLAGTFNMMSERLENMDRERSEFVSNASHELKTPLSSIKILTESLLYQDGVEERVYKEFLSDINKEIDRLTSIIQGLLTLAKADSQAEALTVDKILLSALVYKAVAALKPIASEKDIALTYTVTSELEVECDALKVSLALTNLIDNAIKYTRKGGAVSVSVQRSGQSAAIVVKDNGRGISEKDLPYIFDRFYRVDKARARDTGGSGLGLHIARKIALLHGGSIDVTSEEGKGSTFTLYLPLRS
jgi:DNA-binding response OmpR family regulator/signal transduction histidine kinase